MDSQRCVRLFVGRTEEQKACGHPSAQPMGRTKGRTQASRPDEWSVLATKTDGYSSTSSNADGTCEVSTHRPITVTRILAKRAKGQTSGRHPRGMRVIYSRYPGVIGDVPTPLPSCTQPVRPPTISTDGQKPSPRWPMGRIDKRHRLCCEHLHDMPYSTSVRSSVSLARGRNSVKHAVCDVCNNGNFLAHACPTAKFVRVVFKVPRAVRHACRLI